MTRHPVPHIMNPPSPHQVGIILVSLSNIILNLYNDFLINVFKILTSQFPFDFLKYSLWCSTEILHHIM